MRLSLGTLGASPVSSLCVEAEGPSLEGRCVKLGMQCVAKLNACPSGLFHDCFFVLYMKVFCDEQLNTIQPFEHRVESHFEDSDMNLDDIAPFVVPEGPPWLDPNTGNLK